MNGLLIEGIYTWGGDYWFGRLSQKIQGGRRRVYLTEVFIDHNSHHLKDLPQPDSFAHFQRIERDHPCVFNERMLKERVEKINKYIATK